MQIFEEFGVSPIELLAQIVNFTVLLILLRLFLYKPVLKILDERKKKVAKAVKDAEEIEKRLAKTQEEQEGLLNKARTEANQMIQEAKTEARELSEKNLNETKAIIAEMIEKNHKALLSERQEIIASAKKEIATLVIAATGKISKKIMTESESKKLVEDALVEIEK